MHFTGETTVNSYALVHLVFLLCILLVKTRQIVMHGTFSGSLCILLVKIRYLVMRGYTLWFYMHITGENTVNSYAWVHFVVFY